MKYIIILILIGMIFISGCTKPIEPLQNITPIKDNISVVQPPKNTTIVTPVNNTVITVNNTMKNTSTRNKTTNATDTTNTSIKNTTVAPKDPNLIAHWKFDEISSGTVKDSANNHDGTVVGATIKSGKVGNAIYFDGKDDYVKFSQKTMNEIGSLKQGTIVFWFKYSSLLDKQTIMPIFHIGTDSEQDKDNMFIIELGHSDLQGSGSGPDPTNKRLYNTWVQNDREPTLCYDSNKNMDEDTWHHFALVVSSNGNTGYLDGVEITNRQYNFGKASDQLFLEDIKPKEQFTLGYGKTHHQISPKFVYYQGYLDDMRIYDKALSSSEVSKIYKGE